MSEEILRFKQSNLWEYGYCEGDPLDPLAVPNSFQNKHQHLGFAKTNGKPYLNVVYRACIEPYIHANTKALELGPGRGGWTKCMLPASKIYALDVSATSEKHFWNYLGGVKEHVKYVVVDDFSCSVLPDDYFDYMFSFGCLCHITFEGVTAYAQNLFRKLKSGTNCFWMIADEAKFSKDMGIAQQRFPQTLLDGGTPGCFYSQGVSRTCQMLKDVGYVVVQEDMDLIYRDPIIHFKKP